MIERAVSVSLMASVCILAAAIPASARPWDALVPGVVVEAKADWTSSGDLRIGKARVRVEGRQDRAEIIAPWEGILNGDALLAGCAIPMLDSVRANAGGITPGIWVEADLERAGEVGWVAYRVRPTGSDHHDDIEVEGPIESLNAKGRAVIAGIPVRFSRSAEILNAAHLEADRPSLFFEEVDDDDAVLSGIRTLSGRVKMGGSLRADFEPEENLNLNPARPADLHRSWWAAELQLEAAPGARHRAFVKFGSRSTVVHRDDENQRTNQTDWQFKQGFWLWSPAAAPSWAVQVGRQDFDEEREWLYDENLDAVRVHWRRSTARVEGSLSTRWNSTSSRLDGWTNAILFAEREVRDRHVLALWGIHRANGSDTPTWIGLRSSGRLSRRLRHWVDTASLTGNLDGVRRSAYAIDAGLRYRAIQKNRTEFTVGWARGSGGGDSRETFHSTGLGDNNARFGGVTGFKYYGELLEPELVNLEIVTAAAGFRPTRSSSIDLIFHDYRQVAASRRDFDTALESRPLGLDPDLGSEWNVIVGFEELRQVDIEYDFAYFTPGRAFPESAEAATVHRFKMRFKF